MVSDVIAINIHPYTSCGIEAQQGEPEFQPQTKSPGWKTIIFSFIKAVTNWLYYILGELSDLEMTFYRGFIQTHR